jgi:hypothetical protein
MAYNTGSVSRPNQPYLQHIANDLYNWRMQATQAASTQQGAPAAPRYADAGNIASDASPPAGSFRPTAPPIPGIPTATVAPPDLQPSPVLGPNRLVRLPDGTTTTLQSSPAAKAMAVGSAKILEAIPPKLENLQNDVQGMSSLMDEIGRNANAPGWYQSGAGSEWRTDLAKGVNGFFTSVGGQPLFSQTDIANNEALLKNSNVAAFQMARTMAGGRVALGEVTQANRSVPNMGNTPYGNIVVGHLLMQQKLQQIDRNRFVYEQGQRGVDPGQAGIAFDRVNPPSRYVAAAAAGAMQQAFPQVVAALRRDPQPANVKAVDQKFGDGAAEFILSQGGS